MLGEDRLLVRETLVAHLRVSPRARQREVSKRVDQAGVEEVDILPRRCAALYLGAPGSRRGLWHHMLHPQVVGQYVLATGEFEFQPGEDECLLERFSVVVERLRLDFPAEFVVCGPVLVLAREVATKSKVNGLAALPHRLRSRKQHPVHVIGGSTDHDPSHEVFTTRFAGGKGGRNHLEHELRELHITQKNGQPNHPQTQGKVERFQQTMKKWLRAQPGQPTTIDDLQALLDAFVGQYNDHRPHRSLPHHATPATVYTTRPKATPSTDRTTDSHDRVRHDKIDKVGSVTLRVAGRLRHIGVGRTYARTDVILLVHDLHVTIVNAATGEILRDLLIDPRLDYQPTGRPPGPSRTKK